MEGMKDNIRIATVCMRSEGKEANLKKMEKYISSSDADLILFPEMCLTGYDMYIDETVSYEEKLQMAEGLDGPSCRRLEALAKEKGIYIVFGMAERKEDILFNSAAAIGPDGIIGAYRKIHPFGPENNWCKKGEKPFIFDTPWGPVGIGICYDTYQFPELMRYYVYKGCRLYLNPTALLEEVDKEGSRQAFLDYYKPLLDYGVLCNTIYIASSNLTGKDRLNTFGGGSVVIGPKRSEFFETQIKTYAGDYDNMKEGIFTADIDLSLATRRLCIPRRQTGEPDFRPQTYIKFYEEE